MAILEDVKLALRITNTALDTEINDLIAACKIDMSLSGVKEISDTDAIVKRAIITYCKSNFGLDNKDSEKYQSSYELLRNHLSMSVEYAPEV